MKPRNAATDPSGTGDDARVATFEVDGVTYIALSVSAPCAARLPSLTDAERAVVDLVLAGSSNAHIAAARGTSVRTVANQLAAIYRKLGVVSRAELVRSMVGPTPT